MSPLKSLQRGLLGCAAVSLLLPAAASADKVRSLQPWHAGNAYKARVDLDGRPLPRLNPVAKVDHVRAGQWVRIQCQVLGEEAYGSRVWSKVRGLYVPDTYLKTYTDGLLAGVPRCGSSEPQPHPAGPSRTVLRKAVRKVAFERVYGSNWRIFQARFPDDGIIWSANGCSVPQALLYANAPGVPLGHSLSYWSGVFRKSCDRHDFGYRNYGSKTDGLKLDPSARRKKMIDDRFHANMDYQCKRVFSHKYLEAAQRGLCYKASDVYWWAVSKFGGSHFS